MSRRLFLGWWLGGIAIFVVSIFLHAPLASEAVTGGIFDHQAAPDAASVDAIQQAWAEGGQAVLAGLAMITDLVFITVYSAGCVLGGLFYRAQTSLVRAVLAEMALVAGGVFFISDIGETIAQLVQLVQFAGNDQLARLASHLGPIKVVSFLVSFALLAIALLHERLSRAPKL
ncbi:MAG: hypothetical protein AAGH57_11810 [Pseudomonadota bacterium]